MDCWLRTLTWVFRSFLWGRSDYTEMSLLIFCLEGEDLDASVLGAELGRRVVSLTTRHSAHVHESPLFSRAPTVPT